MQHHHWLAHLPSSKFAQMLGPDRIELNDILQLVFPKPPDLPLPDSNDDEIIFHSCRRQPDPAVWQIIVTAYRQEMVRATGGYSTHDFYIPVGDIYVFIKEHLVGMDEELLKDLDAYDFDTLAEAVHTNWRLVLLDKVRETKKRKRELDEALDLVECMPVYIKKARGDSPPEISGLE